MAEDVEARGSAPRNVEQETEQGLGSGTEASIRMLDEVRNDLMSNSNKIDSDSKYKDQIAWNPPKGPFDHYPDERCPKDDDPPPRFPDGPGVPGKPRPLPPEDRGPRRPNDRNPLPPHGDERIPHPDDRIPFPVGNKRLGLGPKERDIAGGLPTGLDSGIFDTNTGDKVEYKDGNQIVTTKDGSRFELDKDGNISGDVVSIKANKDGSERIATLKDGSTVLLDKNGIARIEHPMPASKDGLYTLTNGDRLFDDGQSQTLTTKDGNVVKVNADGSYEVNGKLLSASGDGKTLKLGDGTVVQLENGKISGVERNGKQAAVAGEIPRMQWDPRAGLILKNPRPNHRGDLGGSVSRPK